MTTRSKTISAIWKSKTVTSPNILMSTSLWTLKSSRMQSLRLIVLAMKRSNKRRRPRREASLYRRLIRVSRLLSKRKKRWQRLLPTFWYDPLFPAPWIKKRRISRWSLFKKVQRRTRKRPSKRKRSSSFKKTQMTNPKRWLSWLN